jgi:hypothetical protein
MELKITKEKILEAASKCSTARQTLSILFPEAFNQPSLLIEKDNNSTSMDLANINGRRAIAIALGAAIPKYGVKTHFLLCDNFNWKIETYGTSQYLIPIKK